MLRACALSLVLACAGCGRGLFACEEDEDCQGGGMPGMCAAEGVCSFPDAECVSGQRYGDHAGDLSGLCVPHEDGTETATTTMDGSASSPTSVTVDASGPVDTGESVSTGGSVADDSTSSPVTTLTTQTEGDATTDGASTTGEPVDPTLLVWLQFADDIEDDAFTNSGVLGGVATCVVDCPDAGPGMAEFGGQECLAFPSDPLMNGPITLAAWVWVADDGLQDMFLMGKAFGELSENTWELYRELNRVLEPVVAVEMFGPPNVRVPHPSPPFETWFHLAGTWDGATVTLWIDGQLEGEAPSLLASFDDHAVRFGCDDDAGLPVYFFDGWLADVRIYSSALDAAAIAELAAIPPAPPPP